MSFITDTSTQLTANYTQNSDIINNPNSLSTNFITSNILTNVLFPYDTKALRTTALSSYTTTTALTTLLSGKEANLTFNAPLTRSTNTISLDLSSYDTIALRNTALASYTNTTTTASTYINSNQLASQKYINSNSIDNIILYYISSNTITNLNSFYVSSNTISKLNSFFISSNNLKDQKYINSNSISDIVNFYISSNLLSKQNYMNSNSIDLNYLHIDAGNNISVNGILKFGTRVQDYLIDLYGGTYGFGINASTLRYNSYSAHKFYSSATNTFTIDTSGNVTALATINGATLQQGGVGVSTLITNALASYLPLTGGTVSGTITVNATSCGTVTLNSGGATANISGYVGFFNNAGVRRGYIGWVGANTNYMVLETENGCLGYEVSGHLIVDGTLYANTISSTGLTTLLNAKQATLTASTTLLGTGGSITGIDYTTLINKPTITDLSTISSTYISSNQLSSQNYLQTKLNGYVGIGTAPNYTLDCYGTDNFIGRCKIDGGGHDANKVDAFSIGRGDGSTKEFTGIKFNVTLGTTVGETYSNHSHINFYTWGNNIAGSREVARITSRGRLGIGSTLPAFEIDTSGSIRATNQVLAYAGSGNGYINMSNGGTGACGYLGVYNPSGTRCCYIGAMNNANTYMPIVAESPCVGFDFSGKLKIYGNLLNDYYFNNNGNPHATLQDFNNATSFGYNFIQGTTNGPGVNGATNYYNWSMGLGSDYAYSTYVCQMAVGRNVANPYLNVRYRENGTWGGWNKIASGIADNIVSGANITVGTISAGATTLSSTLSVAGTTTCSSTLTTAGEIQTTGTNVINFGYNVSKVDGATGRIGYGTYEANALCIVGGSTTGSRKVTIWDYVEIKGSLTTAGTITMPNGSWFYGGNNVSKRQGLYLNGVYGGGYYYNTIDYSTYVSSEAGTEFCFRITAYNVDQDIPSACLQCYHVWLRNVSGYRTSYATIIGQTAGCGIQIGEWNTNLALTYPNNTAGSGLKHIIFENIAWASS